MSSERRFQPGFREADATEPGLVQEDDGTVWLVNPDGTREQLGGGGGGGTGLPPEWTLGPGGDVSIAPSDPTASALFTLTAPTDFENLSSGILLRLEDEHGGGQLTVDAFGGIFARYGNVPVIDSDGRVRLPYDSPARVVVGRGGSYNELPDLGPGTGELEVVGQDGTTVAWWNNAGDHIIEAPFGLGAVSIRSRDGGAGTIDTQMHLSNASLELWTDDAWSHSPSANALPNIGIRKVNPAGPYLAFVDSSYSSTPFFTIDEAGRVGIAVHSAPADADIATGQVFLWFEQTNGAAKLKVKGKQANGTVVVGELALA